MPPEAIASPSPEAPPAARRIDTWLRITAGLLGTLATSIVVSVVLALALPIARDARFAVGYLLMPILWVTGICLAFLARSGRRAWALCGVVIAVATVLGVATV